MRVRVNDLNISVITVPDKYYQPIGDHGHLAKLGYGKYLTVSFLVRLSGISDLFVLAMAILVW